MLKKLLILLIVLSVLCRVGGVINGISTYGFDGFIERINPFSSKDDKGVPTEQPTKTPELTSTPTPTPVVKESTLTIKVNGNAYIIPDYEDDAYTEVNGGIPFFTDSEKTCTEPLEIYPDLDSLGRCGSTLANICPELMPEDDREEIGMVKPSGWHTIKYPDLIEDLYLFNRCHLIGFQLAGENANENNLITGTRYLNIDGMLDHENMIARYVRKTKNHVMYRVTPVFADDELVCRGVLMEAYSVEDNGKGVCFCIFAYNVQPGISIDYATGDSQRRTEGEYKVSKATCKLKLLTP